MEARKRTVLEEMHTAVAALYCVPTLAQKTGGCLGLNETQNIPASCRVDGITTQVLDALAAICVSEPDSAYAVTYAVDGSNLELLVASNLAAGVPAGVVQHLEHVWSHMRRLAVLSVGDRRDLPSEYAKFIDELYSFAWPALRHRLASTTPGITQALDSLVEPDINMGSGNDSSAVLSEDLKATFCKMRALVQTLRATVLDNDNDNNEVPSVKVHSMSIALRTLLAQNDVVSVLERLYEFVPGAPNIAADVHSIVWQSSASDILFAFGSSTRFASMAGLDLHVAPIAPCSKTSLANADLPQLREEGGLAYLDPMVDIPEPNFDADFTSTVLEPLRRCLEPPNEGPVNVRDVTAHAESVLLAHIELRSSESIYKGPPYCRPYCQYIGTSEPSCLPCYRLFEAYNSAQFGKTRWMFVRGTTSRSPLLWVPPDFSSFLSVMRATKFLWYDFKLALSSIRKQRTSARQQERAAQGQAISAFSRVPLASTAKVAVTYIQPTLGSSPD